MEVDSPPSNGANVNIKAKNSQELPNINGHDNLIGSPGSFTKTSEKIRDKKKKKKPRTISLSDDERSNGNSEVQILAQSYVKNIFQSNNLG